MIQGVTFVSSTSQSTDRNDVLDAHPGLLEELAIQRRDTAGPRHLIRFSRNAALMAWALTLSLTLNLALYGPAKPSMGRLP